MGEKGGLLIVDDPPEGHPWSDADRAVAEHGGGRSLRLLILRRWRDRGASLPAPYSVQDLTHLSLDAAARIHHEMLERLAPVLRGRILDLLFPQWAAADPSVRQQPLFAMAAALYMSHQPRGENYPSQAREAIVGLARESHERLNRDGEQAGLAGGVVPLLAALGGMCGGLGEEDLRRMAASTALTLSDVDTFVDRVKRLPAWRGNRFDTCDDSLPRAEFVKLVVCDALQKGLGVRLGAALQTADVGQLAVLDRTLQDAAVDTDLCDQLARVLRLPDDGWLARLEGPRAGSLLGRLALHAAKRRTPRLPVEITNSAVDEEHAKALVDLARSQARECDPATAVEAAEETVRIYRHLAQTSDLYDTPLDDGLWTLADYLEQAQSDRVADIRKECVAHARVSGKADRLVAALWFLGHCEGATDAERIEALREVAEYHRESHRDLLRASTLEELATLAPLDEATRSIFEAEEIRAAALGSTPRSFPRAKELDRLFEKLKDVDPGAALVVARLGVAAARDAFVRYASTSRFDVVRHCVLLGRCLERLAAVAHGSEARDALVEALALYRRGAEASRNPTRSIFVVGIQRVEGRLQELVSDSVRQEPSLSMMSYYHKSYVGYEDERRLMRVYESPATPLRVLVPDSQAERMLADHSELLKPEDVFSAVAALPEQRTLYEVVLREEHDELARHEKYPNWPPARKSYGNYAGQGCFHGVSKSDDPVAILTYHWAMTHILCGRGRTLLHTPFTLAMRLELDLNDDLAMRRERLSHYSSWSAEVDENWSIHMAGDILAQGTGPFEKFAAYAPLRTVALCRGLRAAVDVEGTPPLADWLARRVEYAETTLRDVARRQLVDIVNTSTAQTRRNVAMNLLLHYGAEDDFRSLVRVRTLHLITLLTEEMFSLLACLDGLEELDLLGLDLADDLSWGDVFSGLSPCPHLKTLTFGYNERLLRDTDLASLHHLKSLTDLDLAGTWITDWAVPLLAARQSLKRLDIRNTHISQEGVASLRRALRECEIISEW